MKTTTGTNRSIGRKPALLLSVLVLAMGLFTSCSKDDGPPSRTSLLTGTWVLEEINGIRVNSSLIIEITFEANGDYEEDINESGDVERYTGEWEWNSSEDEITIDYDQNFSDWELDVDELTATTLEVDDGSNTYLLQKD